MARLKQHPSPAEDAGAVDHAVETTEVVGAGLNPSVRRRRVFSVVGMQQHPISTSHGWIQGGDRQGLLVSEPQAEPVAIGQQALSDGPADPAAGATDQEGAHGDKAGGLQR